MTTIHETASRNIFAFLEEGRLIQKSWHTKRDGKEMACLLGAAGGYSATKECPAELMPAWLAECTVTLFDGLGGADFIPVSRRYADLIGRWSVLSPDAWNAVLSRWLVRVIDQAIDAVPVSAKTQDCWPAIEKSAADCRNAIESGNKDAARAAARAARAAAYAGAYAARAAAYAYASAYAAADAAADATAYAAYAYASAYAAADAAARAACAARAAYKSLFSGLLDEIEREIGGVA